MADVKITQLPPGTALDGTELFESVQNDQSVRLTAAQIAAYVESDVFGNVISVAQGGTGAMSLTGYVFGAGTAPLEGRPQIPAADIDGLATGAFVNIHVGNTPPASPSVGDLWVDTN
jgi:hypothetical protein